MLITPTEIQELKNRVKAECTRRGLSTYTGSNYEYTVTLMTGAPIAAEHYNKIAVPLSAINADQVTLKEAQGLTISRGQFTTLDAFTTTCENRKQEDSSNNDCKSSCTGLCYGCNTTCTGTCTGSCTGSCSTGCSGGCKGSCRGCSGCSGSCT